MQDALYDELLVRLLDDEDISERGRDLVDAAAMLKEHRGSDPNPLADQTWAMIFTKSSTRTRVSFEVGIRELGGFPMFLSANDIQLGRGELIKAVKEYFRSDDEEAPGNWLFGKGIVLQ